MSLKAWVNEYISDIATLVEDENPCWKGYEMVGMKTKDGKEVPNCVPKNEGSESDSDMAVDQLETSIRDAQEVNHTT
jgi:hypothetical protein